ncbi:hypothetical protein BGW80DRAFT_376507 [Lactifluus volemus]|nr:hypothetical protein BGW80DRAFT_376507 [Lactifluus volemus]
MSQTEHQTVNITDCEKEVVAPTWAQKMAQDHEPKTKFTDGSARLFTMYCNMTQRENERVRAWLNNLQGVVIFMGLFSAAVAALLTLTVQDLKRDPQEMSAFYLENIYKLQFLGDFNASRPFTPARPPQFTAPRHAIWVNALLFASLCLDIFTVMLALAIREGVPRRLRYTESPKYSPQSRARLREMLVSERWISLAIVTILSFSGLFFFVGLFIYLFHINRAVFGAFLCCACLSWSTNYLLVYWTADVSVSYRAFCSFVVYMQIKLNSSFIRRLSLGQNGQQGPTTVYWIDYLRLSSRIPI